MKWGSEQIWSRRMTKKIVFRVEDGMDRRDILATTYQMRNFYRQLGDGYFTALDVMNYIQHQQVMKWIPKNAAVLDMCCGRGLMLPLLRYHKKEIRQYVGIDIKASNATFLEKRVTNGKPIEEDYYPFPVEFVEGNVATMNEVLDLDWFDFIIYTASIEHMHPDANTPEGQDGYDTQYRAHVYEWKVSELEAGLRETGWEIVHKYSLLANKKDLKKAAKNRWLLELVEDLEKVIPNEWLIPVLAPAFPDIGKEMAILAKAV
jgi:SAM-dependent methyltransferase